MVRVEDQEEADRVLENYLRKRVRDMIHQARVDAVKVYYHKMQNQTLDDALARPIELDYEQYMHGQLEWCKDEVWPYLCSYWCSDDFKLKRKRGQECRLRAEEIAQNHGGSRPFTETQQVLVRYLSIPFTIVQPQWIMAHSVVAHCNALYSCRKLNLDQIRQPNLIHMQ